MTKKSITSELSELFELYKSGTISKEEFEMIKSEMISDKENYKSEEKESIASPPLPEVKEVNGESSSEKSQKNYTFNNKKFLILTIISGFLIVILSFFLILKPKEWDETWAKEIIIDELMKHQKSTENISQDLNLKFINFKDIILTEKELKVVLTSSSDGHTNFSSVFEFQKNRGWKLTKKSINFAQNNGYEIQLHNIAPDNYCILLIRDENAMGGRWGLSQDVFTFINDELKLVFSSFNLGDRTSNYSLNDLRINFIKKNVGYYDIEINEGFYVGNNMRLQKVIYKFDGLEYVNY